MVERFNQTRKTMLSMVVEPQQRDWDTWLPYAYFAYNIKPSINRLGSLLAELMLGRTVRMPLETTLRDMEEEGF